MKNFKKLLVTLLALVLLVCGATVVTLAADTPAEIMAEAQILLDQATRDGEYIAVRSQKMRELDTLIESKLSTIRNSQEWRDFQVGYRAAQNQLKEDCVVEATESMNKLMDKETSATEAAALYSGLSQLIAHSGDGRGYFDTESEAFVTLSNRMLVAEAIAKLQTAEDSVVAKDKGAALFWIDGYKTEYLDPNEEITQSEDYKLLTTWFAELYATISETLYADIRALTDEACLPTTTFARAIEISDEIDSYFSGCYFDKSVPAFGMTRVYANFARVYAYLNEIERTRGLVAQGTLLKELVAVYGSTTLDVTSDLNADFVARYNALIDTSDADSVASRLCKLADGYKKDVSDVFTEGYNGPLKTAKDIDNVTDELEALVATCYFPAGTTYAKDVAVCRGYAKIYDFYVAMQDLESDPDAYISRNNLYKAAVSSYNSLSGDILNAEAAFNAPFLALYTDLISKAGAEINQILNEWLLTATLCDVKDPEGAYTVTLEDAMDAYDKLQTYYIEKTTALYFSVTEDKALTSRIKVACQKVEERTLADLMVLLAQAKSLVAIPEELATVDVEALAAGEAKLDELLVLSDGLTVVYMDETVLEQYLHDLYVSRMLLMLCRVEIEFTKEDGDASALVLYNELKTFTMDHFAMIDTAAEDYLSYLAYLNKTEVKMGNANVPGAREYLDALAAVVDTDSFDKVYALMHLQEYMRQNTITRPDASDTTSASALFYQEYDLLSGKVAAWRKALADAREANVPMSDYALTGVNSWNMEDKQLTATKGSHSFVSPDTTHYGAGGSNSYATFSYTGSGDGYMVASLPSSTANLIFEMDITTFTTWPSSGVSFNSGTNGLDTGKRLYPWIAGFTGDGQIAAPKGNTHGYGKTLTNREGGYIIPGQWTHFVIVYNAAEKMVSYYVNDEKIVDADGNDSWSCGLGESFNFNEALRIGHGNTDGSFSIDNLQIYVGNQPRNINLFKEMSALKKFAYYTDYVKQYVDSNGTQGTALDAKTCYDEILALHVLYWGIKNEGDTEMTYLFDENTYWGNAVAPVTDITYEEFKQAVDDYLYVAAQADTVIDGALVEATFNEVVDMITKLEALTGIANLSKRTSLLAELEAYIETNASYLSRLNEEDMAVYEQCLARKTMIAAEIEAYARANEYISMVKKLAAARDLYSRTVYRSQAEAMMQMMETDAALGYFDLEAIKTEIAEFAAAIETFTEQSALLDNQLIQDNDKIIVDCMSRFPATPEEAIKNYAYLNKYIVLVRSIILEGKYTADNLRVQEALAVYERMNTLFYDALQKDHAANVQALIDQFDAETSYIARLGIYTATKSYLEQNAATIDMNHDAIKGVYSQYELMEAKFGSEEGREEQWAEYGQILEANAVKFANLVVQMRFSQSYAELLELREQAAALYYYMDSSSADAQLAVEYYHAYEKLLTEKALRGDAFIDAAYALTKTDGMEQTYKAILAAKAAFELADTTYDNTLVYQEVSGETEITVVFNMQDAIAAYEIALAQYNSFVTVTNNEVNVVLDVVCAVRASFSINQPIVALFKKYYD